MATPDPPKLADTIRRVLFYHVPFCWEIGRKGNKLRIPFTMSGDFTVGEFVGVVLDLGVEVAIKDIKRQFGGIDTDLTEAVEDCGTTAVLRI